MAINKSPESQAIISRARERDIQLYLENYADVDHEIVGTFTDVESGRKADRPELINAIELCKATGAILLCAKLDRAK